MSKFNRSVRSSGITGKISDDDKNVIDQIKEELYSRPDATTNYEGALTFSLDPQTELYLRAASCLVGEPKFYTDAKESDRDLLDAINKVAQIEPEFILKLAVYCREELYLRSVPIVLLAEFANNPSCIGKASGEAKVPGARKYVRRIIQRADEMTELMAYQLARNKIHPRSCKPPRNERTPVSKRDDMQSVLPRMLKFGLANTFCKFDKYQISKYNRDSGSGDVKMRDVMFMTHPKWKGSEQKEILDKLTNKTLESPETWEVMRSTGKMSWHDVINHVFFKEGRVNNYMAILRNLRNCLHDESVTGEDYKLLTRMVSDKDSVLHSKQLPFRFLAAYRELSKMGEEDMSPVGVLYIGDIMGAIEMAAGYSVDNFPKLTGSSSLIACDVSGSMQKEISKNSSIQRFDIGILLGMIAHKFAGHTITGIFGDSWKVVPMDKSSGILRNTLEMHGREGEVGYSTNGYKVIEWLLDNDIKVDRILIFTDCQMWDSDRRPPYDFRRNWSMYYAREQTSFAEVFLRYQRRYPDVKLYCFDLAGYGNVMIPSDTRNVCLIGGFSDRVFDFISVFEGLGSEKGRNVVLEKIRSIRV